MNLMWTFISGQYVLYHHIPVHLDCLRRPTFIQVGPYSFPICGRVKLYDAHHARWIARLRHLSQRPVNSPTQFPRVFTPLVGVHASQFLVVGTQVFEGGESVLCEGIISHSLDSPVPLPSLHHAPLSLPLKPDPRNQECATFTIHLN